MSSSSSASSLCEDILMEILLRLPVKVLGQCRCISKSFQSLLTDPMFVKEQIQRSSKNTNFLITCKHDTLDYPCIVSCPLTSLLENPSSSSSSRDLSLGFHLKGNHEVVGTCNGLVCLISRHDNYKSCMFCLWNPVTRQTFEYPECVLEILSYKNLVTMFGFGYDSKTDTYKVVALLSTLSSEDGSLGSCEVKVCNVADNDNDWRSIQNFPADPVATKQGCGVYLNNSLNWIALALPLNQHLHSGDDDDSKVTFDELVIVSLHMGSERYTNLLLPLVLDGVLHTDVFTSRGYSLNEVPRIGVLNDCLSLFLRDTMTNHFSIWQMKKFGNRNSWIRLLHIAMHDIDHMPQPLCMFNDHVIMIAYRGDLIEIYYDEKDNLVKCIELSNHIVWVHDKNFVQSLVSPTRY